MPSIAARTPAGGGLGVIVPKPTLTHTPGVGFTITSYDPSYVYVLSAGTRSGDTISLPMSTPATVAAKGPKGVVASSLVTIERRTITFNRSEFVQTGFELINGPCPVGYTCYGTCGPGTNNCGRSLGYTQYGLEDYPPSGFTKLNGEWVRNV